MLAYQSVLFFLGHLYYRASRRAANERSKMPDSELPPVSVIVPCHNEELVIARTLHALLALDYPAEKVEFLIVNDGRNDATAAAVRSEERRVGKECRSR